jgi:hypothetical protein
MPAIFRFAIGWVGVAIAVGLLYVSADQKRSEAFKAELAQLTWGEVAGWFRQ